MINEILNVSSVTKNDKKAKLLFIFFRETNVYRRDLNVTEYMSFFTKDKELLEKYNDILEKVSIKECFGCIYLLIKIDWFSLHKG